MFQYNEQVRLHLRECKTRTEDSPCKTTQLGEA